MFSFSFSFFLQELNAITSNDQNPLNNVSDLNKVIAINTESNVDKLNNVNPIIVSNGTTDIGNNEQQKVNSIESNASIANELSKFLSFL